jgi:hypothetical protein
MRAAHIPVPPDFSRRGGSGLWVSSDECCAQEVHELIQPGRRRQIMALDELIEAACKAATHVGNGMTGDEDLIPFVLSVPATGKGRMTVIGSPFPQHFEKRRRFFNTLFGDEVRKNNAKEVAFCYMAWMAKLSDDDIQAIKDGLSVPSVSSRAGRYESVVIMCANAEGEFASLSALVHRMPDKSVQLGDFIRDDNSNEGLIPEALCRAFAPEPEIRKPWWRFGR